MTLKLISRFMLGAALLGSLACASSRPDRSQLQAQRVAELDRLGEQAGMPDTWQTPNLKEMRAYRAGANRAAPASSDDQK